MRARQDIAEYHPDTAVQFKCSRQFPEPVRGYLAIIVRHRDQLTRRATDCQIATGRQPFLPGPGVVNAPVLQVRPHGGLGQFILALVDDPHLETAVITPENGLQRPHDAGAAVTG